MKIPIGIFALAWAVLAIGCGGHQAVMPVSPATAPKGSISFTSIHSAPTSAASIQRKAGASVVQAADATTGTIFNFGNIPSTQVYLFQIENTGTAAVDNVVITTDNPAAIVTPGNIAVLPIQGEGSIVPLTEVQVIHGVGQNGHGTAALLPPGALAFHLTAAGTDASGNPVTATCEIDLNVQVAQFTIEDYAGTGLMTASATQPAPVLTTQPFNYGMPLNTNVTAFPLNGWYAFTTNAPPALALDGTKTSYTLVNKGNVPLTVTDFGDQVSITGTATGATSLYTVQPGGSLSINLTYDSNTSNLLQPDTIPAYVLETPIVINSGNVVFNSLYPADGSGNFFLFYYWVQVQ